MATLRVDNGGPGDSCLVSILTALSARPKTPGPARNARTGSGNYIPTERQKPLTKLEPMLFAVRDGFIQPPTASLGIPSRQEAEAEPRKAKTRRDVCAEEILIRRRWLALHTSRSLHRTNRQRSGTQKQCNCLGFLGRALCEWRRFTSRPGMAVQGPGF